MNRKTWIILFLMALFISSPFADSKKIERWILQLEDAKKANAAVAALVKYGQKAVPHLWGEALEGRSFITRGWSIVCLSEIGGTNVNVHLEKLYSDANQPILVRTWAAAARIQQAKDFKELMQLASLANTFPATQRPLGMGLIAALQKNSDISVESLMELSYKNSFLPKILAPAILNMGEKKLAHVMKSAKNQNVRRQAAGYLGALAKKGKTQEIANITASIYRFNPQANQVPWAAGPLFIPGIQWPQKQARSLVKNLISWYVWCEHHNKRAQQRQIHNNIRSLQLAYAAGYRSPGWNQAGVETWLFVWGKAFGKKAVEDILQQQDLLKNPRYQKVLQRLHSK